MRTYWQYSKKAYGLFFKHLNRFIGYRLASSIIVAFLLTPLLSFASQQIMSASGYDYVTNNLLKKFLMSPSGILLVAISLLIGFMVILLELGGMIVLSHQTILGGRESRFIDILKYSLKRFKLLLGVDGVLLAVYFVILAPLFNSGLSTSLLENIKIPGFILQSINASDLLSLLFLLAILIILFLTLRWMFALFVLMLDDQADKKILKISNKVRRGNMKKIIKFSLVSLLYNTVVLLIFALIFVGLCLPLALIFSSNPDLLVILVIGLGGLLLLVFLAIEVPVSLMGLTMLYHDLSGKNEPLDIPLVETSTILNKVLSNKFFIAFGTIIVVLISGLLAYVVYESSKDMAYEVQITAHRGSSFEAPENTMSAIEIAYENGADYVEIDVQLTKDGHVILLHDESFKRTTGLNKRPDQVTLEEIRPLDAGRWFSSEFTGEPIPTLKEVMTYARGKIKLNIEIKGSNWSPDVRSAVVNMINGEDYLRECVVTSLKYEDIEGVEFLDSRIETGYIMFVAFGDLEKLHTDFYSVEATNVTETFVNDAHSIGREVHVWTINKADDMRTMMDLGVDNIITDNDKTLKKIILESEDQ